MGLREARRAQERLWGKETTLGSSELKADQVEAFRKARTCHLQMTPSHQKVHSVSSVGAQNKSNIIIAVKYIPPQARGMIYLKTELSTFGTRQRMTGKINYNAEHQSAQLEMRVQTLSGKIKE